ncbi:MAG: dodecin family protein [Candidatus Parcubacteria bacterium]|nr:dodecin family protein [Candidatus Parcubacteria bacterium]
MCIKIVELIGCSEKNFEDAIADGVRRAGKTIRGITGVDVIGQTAVVKDNKIVEYHVNMKVAFKVE